MTKPFKFRGTFVGTDGAPLPTTHTPEPWYEDDGGIYSACDLRVADTFNTEDPIPEEEAAANAARIVACVNACAGINPEAVRDLLAALEFYADAARYHEQDGWLAQDLGELARAAVTKAKGGS